MVREAKLAWNDLGRSCVSEIGLRKLWDDPNDVEEPLISDDTPDSRWNEDSHERNRATKKKTARRKNGVKNLADADWINWV